ncbi:hypothetical protein M3J09_009645 [Ascochyta lentis]
MNVRRPSWAVFCAHTALVPNNPGAAKLSLLLSEGVESEGTSYIYQLRHRHLGDHHFAGSFIRGYAHNGYSAEVFGQRCKLCDHLGALTLDVQSYVERVAFRLKTWAGVRMDQPLFEKKKGPPHESGFCEGCARGGCRLGGD